MDGGLCDALETSAAHLKAVLHDIVRDLIDLRANLDVLARFGNQPTKTLAASQDAKSLAMQEHEKSYDKLLQKIDAL